MTFRRRILISSGDDLDIAHNSARHGGVLFVGAGRIDRGIRLGIAGLKQIVGEHPAFDFFTTDIGKHVAIDLNARGHGLAALLFHFPPEGLILDNILLLKRKIVFAEDGADAFAPATVGFQVGSDFGFVHKCSGIRMRVKSGCENAMAGADKASRGTQRNERLKGRNDAKTSHLPAYMVIVTANITGFFRFSRKISNILGLVLSKRLTMLSSFPLLRSRLVATALLLCGICNSYAVTLTDGPKVEITSGGVSVTWTTDVAAGTRLSFGTSADALTQKAEGAVTATHTVTLSGLQPGTTYYYAVGSARAKLGTGTFTTTGKAAPGGKTAAPAATDKKATPKPANTPTLPAPPTRSTWASLDSLPDHFNRHGKDFSAKSQDDYAAQAWQFLQRAKQEALPMKWDDTDSTLRVWDPKKRIFAAYTRAGKTRTFFKPGNPDYWVKQPGNSVKPSDLHF